MTVHHFNELANHVSVLLTMRAECKKGSIGYRVYTNRIVELETRMRRAMKVGA